MTETTLPGGSAPGDTVALTYSGAGNDYFRILWRGTLLSLITLGIYRFWMMTELRRHLWMNTGVGRDRLEYTGSGIELFFGFLFAIAILAPFYVLYFVAGIEATRYKAFLSFPLIVVFILFAEFAIYRARRYRLTRTTWRGIRFWMSGSGVRYMLISVGWMILVGLTLGLLLPWREAALERYKMSNTLYGDLRGSFVGRPWDFFKRGVWIWALPFGAAVLLVGFSAASLAAKGGPHGLGSFSFFHLLAVIILIASPFLVPAYRRIEMRWWIEGLRLGEVRFQADPDAIRFAGLYWSMIGSILLAFVAFGVVILIGFISLKSAGILPTAGANTEAGFLHSGAGWVSIALVILAYVALILTIGIINRWFMQRGFWKIVTNGSRVENLGAADHVKAMGQPSNALGEGLMALLDVSGF